MVHYVPIAYDLSDVKEKIEWLMANDDNAKQIAQNAMEFARTVLSPEFQRGYLLKEITRAAGL
jgi:spore maturation protein CgeB